jgi:hypothetical protein
MYRQSTLPINWPKALGGWGFPGEQTAPPGFRKAAGVILYGLQPAETERYISQLRIAHLTNGLNSLPGEKIKEVLNTVITQDPHPFITMFMSKLPEYRDTRKVDHPIYVKDVKEYTTELAELASNKNLLLPSQTFKFTDVYDTRDTVEKEVINRITSFYSLHPSNCKLSAKSKPRIGSIVLKVRSVIKELNSRWKSVNPTIPSKALVALDNRLNKTVVPSYQLDEILFYSLVPDRFLSNSLKNIEPTRRFNLFVRKNVKDRHQSNSGNANDNKVLLEIWKAKHGIKQKCSKPAKPNTITNFKSKTLKKEMAGLNNPKNKTISHKEVRKLQKTIDRLASLEMRPQVHCSKLNSTIKRKSNKSSTGRTLCKRDKLDV